MRSRGTYGWFTQAVVPVLGPPALTAALVPARGHLTNSNVALVPAVAVVGAAAPAGRRDGAVAGLTAALGYDFFFTRPYGSLSITHGQDVVTAGLLVVLGLATGGLVMSARRARAGSALSRRDVERMRAIAELAAGAEPDGRLVHTVEREVATLLQARACRFEPSPFTEPLPELAHGRVRLPSTPDGVPTGRVALPVAGRGRTLGRLVVALAEPGTGVSLPVEDRAAAVALADQLGAALAGRREQVGVTRSSRRG